MRFLSTQYSIYLSVAVVKSTPAGQQLALIPLFCVTWLAVWFRNLVEFDIWLDEIVKLVVAGIVGLLIPPVFA